MLTRSRVAPDAALQRSGSGGAGVTDMAQRPITVCFCTSNPPDREPRFVRQAAALANARPAWKVMVTSCIPRGKQLACPASLVLPNVNWRPVLIPWRGNGRARLLFDEGRHALGKLAFQTAGVLTSAAMSRQGAVLSKALKNVRADIYVGSSIDALIPVFMAARRDGGKVVFDAMEYYSDMGDAQTALEQSMVRAAEADILPRCDLVLASSSQVGDALAEAYGLRNVLPIYNAPPVYPSLPRSKVSGFSLYWRNATIGISQRGLGDVLKAMQGLPEDVVLHVRGNLPSDGGQHLRENITDLHLTERVLMHPPHAPEDAVPAAAGYHVGVCPEQGGPRNQALTVSNKLFDFMMAGLPVIVSDLPGIRSVVERANAGLTYRSRHIKELRDCILTLYSDRGRLAELSRAARDFALREGNLEHEMARFVRSIADLIPEHG